MIFPLCLKHTPASFSFVFSTYLYFRVYPLLGSQALAQVRGLEKFNNAASSNRLLGLNICKTKSISTCQSQQS